MVRRFSVSPRLVDLRLAAVLAGVLVVFSTASTLVWGQPTTREESMSIRAERTLQIAQEYVSRKAYTQAEMTLASLQGQGELAAYVGDADKQIVAGLNELVTKALEDRRRVAKLLMESDELAEQGQYAEAAQRLIAAAASEYLNETEREHIEASLKPLQEKSQGQPKAIEAANVTASKPAAEKPKAIDVEAEVKAVGELAAAAEAAAAETKTYVVPGPAKPAAADTPAETPRHRSEGGGCCG